MDWLLCCLDLFAVLPDAINFYHTFIGWQPIQSVRCLDGEVCWPIAPVAITEFHDIVVVIRLIEVVNEGDIAIVCIHIVSVVVYAQLGAVITQLMLLVVGVDAVAVVEVFSVTLDVCRILFMDTITALGCHIVLVVFVGDSAISLIHRERQVAIPVRPTAVA